MSRWFRHYAGMMRDDKLVRAAIKSGQTVERVLWIWGAILESAAETNDDGKFDLDTTEVAYFLRADNDDVVSVLAALEAGGRIIAGRVVHWGGRQFQSDTSTARTRRHRDKQKPIGDVRSQPDETDIHRDSSVTDDTRNDGETSLGGCVTAPERSIGANCRSGNAPETETETETETEPQATQLPEPRAKLEPKPGSDAITSPPVFAGIPIALWRGERTREWLDQLEAECREAAGLEDSQSPSLCDVSRIVGLIEAGYDFSRDIVPVLRAAKAKGKRAETWGYYVPAIEQSRASNAAIKPKPETVLVEPKTAWLSETDPHWALVNNAYFARTGKHLCAIGSRNQIGLGAYVPIDLVPPREAAA